VEAEKKVGVHQKREFDSRQSKKGGVGVAAGGKARGSSLPKSKEGQALRKKKVEDGKKGVRGQDCHSSPFKRHLLFRIFLHFLSRLKCTLGREGGEIRELVERGRGGSGVFLAWVVSHCRGCSLFNIVAFPAKQGWTPQQRGVEGPPLLVHQ